MVSGSGNPQLKEQGERDARLELPFGRGKISFQLPSDWQVDVLRPQPVPPLSDPAAEVVRSLEDPRGGIHFEDFRGARRAAIAVSDETRPVPNALLLPPLLERLAALGLSPSQITILIASGLHPPLPPSRFANILPAEILARYRVVAHDAKAAGLDHVGKTSRGTPVFVNPLFREADLRVAVGLIDPHQFVGYTGGVKCAAVGLAGRETIEHCHSLLSDPRAVVGEIRDNPVRQDIEEIGRMMGVHFALNVILDEGNRMVKAYAGDPLAVEGEGSEFCRTVYEIAIAHEYDIVLASPGGYPKDINLYQAQKGLAHATPVVRPGGDILLISECPDGHGEEIFYRTMQKYRSPQEVIRGFLAEPFRMGAHKAYLWARSLAKARVCLVSRMDESLSREFMVEPSRSVEEAIGAIQSRHSRARVAVMPKANSTYARVVG